MIGIKCKYCGKELEITEALEHQISEQTLAVEREKHAKEVEEVKRSAQETALMKAKSEIEVQMKSLQDAADEAKERNRKLMDELTDLTKALRTAKQEKDEAKLEMEKKLLAEEDRIRTESRKKTEDEHRLKDAEKDKKLQEALRVNEELRQKLEQGSQQTQGEVLELELESLLRREFPEDRISEVKKGERGADINEIVVDKLGRDCGVILWETKNAQWSEAWVKKLKEDQRNAHAQLCVLVSKHVPEDINTFAYRDGVWVTTPAAALGLALALRFDLIHVYHERVASTGKNEKMEVLYQYLRSVEFSHRIEAIVEAFNNMQEDLEKEKRWFGLKWARQEKELRKIIDNTHGVYGELQAVTGRELQEIKLLETTN